MKRLIQLAAEANHSHNQEITTADRQIPDGWALIPEDMELENFPYGDLEAKEIDGVMTVTKWIPYVTPEPTPAELSQLESMKAAEREAAKVRTVADRQHAYDTDPVIHYNDDLLTVTAAAKLWLYYAAEGSERAEELQVLIQDAKETIRAQYPD